jgi:hypothetical protein
MLFNNHSMTDLLLQAYLSIMQVCTGCKYTDRRNAMQKNSLKQCRIKKRYVKLCSSGLIKL